MSRQSRKAKQETFDLVVANVLEQKSKDREYLKYRKLSAYISYRRAREQLRLHDEFVEDIKTRGIQALISQQETDLTTKFQAVAEDSFRKCSWCGHFNYLTRLSCVLCGHFLNEDEPTKPQGEGK